MPAPGPLPRPDHSGDRLLRAVNRATSAATAVLDPDLLPGNVTDAVIRHLGGVRADFWRFDGRRPVHLAHTGTGGVAPATIPAVLLRVARGGLAETVPSADLGHGVGADWRRMLAMLDAESMSVHALAIGDQVLGAITVIADPTQPPVAEEALTIFAQHIAAAMQHAELHRAAQDAVLAMRVQNRVLSEFTDERDVESLRSATEQLLVELLGDAAIAVLPTDSLGRVTVPVPDAATYGMLRVATAPEMSFVAATLDRFDAVQLDTPSLRLCAGLGLSSIAASVSPDTAVVWGIELRIGGQSAGVLLLGVPQELSATTAAETRIRELLSALSPAVSIALENAQLFTREHVRASRLSIANALAKTVTECSTRDELHAAVVSGIAELFGYARTVMYDADLKPLHDLGAPAGRHGARERSLISTAMHRRRPSRIERHDRTCHALPLMSTDRIHCVLYAEQPVTITPEQESDDLALLASICEHAAASLLAMQATEEIERNYMDTIQALVHALEARDEYTADHSDVVAEWSLETGRRLGMDEASLRDLELGAILHDIGKVAIPDAILNKPGRLTEEEFEVMKSHTIVGEHILKPIGFLKNVAPIVRHEHERWDGKGYPDGISGEDIPLASRIIFVCDAYHAITSDRPYRTGQTHAFARRIITENAGSQFDPAVVSVFLDVIEGWCIDHEIDTEGADRGISIENPTGKVSTEEAA